MIPPVTDSVPPLSAQPARSVAPGLWRISTPMPGRPREVHAYLAELPGGGWMLVDGGIGTDEAWAALEAGVRGAAGGVGGRR